MSYIASFSFSRLDFSKLIAFFELVASKFSRASPEDFSRSSAIFHLTSYKSRDKTESFISSYDLAPAAVFKLFVKFEFSICS
jgi:hypothetical protein